MASAFNKEVRRSITHSVGRFLAIAIISALGCGFFAGLLMTSIDMNISADEFYDATNASDLYVTGTLGLDDADLDAIARVEGVRSVEPVRMADAYAIHDDEKYVMRFNSIDLDAARSSDTSDGMHAISDDEGYINRPILVEGSWPTGPGECVVAADAVLDEPMQVGDVIEIVAGSGDIADTFARTQFVITGLVRSPYYLMTSNFGSSELGSGDVDSYVFVAPEAYAEDFPYTGAFVTATGAADELYPSDGYDSIADALVARLESMSLDFRVARLSAVQADAQAELDDARAEYDREHDSAMSQLDDAASQLDSAKAQLDDAASTLANSRSELDAAKDELAEGAVQLEAAKRELDEQQERIDAGMHEYGAQATALTAARAEAEARFAAAQAQVDQIPDPAQRAHAQAALDAERAQTEAQFSAGEHELAAAKAQLDAGAAQLVAGKAQYEEARRQADAGQSAYEEGEAAYARGQAEYESGRAEYESGLATYRVNRENALRELADAKTQLDDAQADIDAIELPDFYVLDRGKNVGMAGHEADASRIDQIARVFPLIFFLVAALVSLTTMTRMVEEERMLIGTYKALGYGNARICSKYLIYALLASGIGSIVGILLLSQALPQLIMNSYAIIYALPISSSPIDVTIALFAFALSVGITLLATLFAVLSSLRERPALLMLPRAPKAGKRILLERVGPIWRRLSFSSKVTTRNLFRYKRRFFMAVIGIAGCTALLLTGLGLRDGINDIIEKQFGQIQHFNLEITTNAEQDPHNAHIVEEILASSDIVTDTMQIGRENAIVTREGADKDIRAALVVPADLERFDAFYTLRERVGLAPLALGETGAVVTEKLASELGVSVGDTIEIYDQSMVGEREGVAHEVTVSGIAEYYTGQGIFMSPASYAAVMGTPCNFAETICMAYAPLDQRTALANELLDVGGVEVVSFYDEVIETYRTMLRTVNAVVWVLIIAAALLAFVVLYNLTNININERMREIATLKVLGFTPRETNDYIFRETILLTIIGALIGCVLGIGMESFVVVTAEVDEMMFGRDIHLLSFAIAFALTIVFSFIVSLAMRPKIRAIDMVESLKSVD